MRSLFTIAGHRARTEWLLRDDQDTADVVLIDAETPDSSSEQIRNRLRGKIFVAYSSRQDLPSGFDAYLHKPVRSRELVALLDHLETLLFGEGSRQGQKLDKAS